MGSALFDEYDYEREIHRLVDSLGIANSIEFMGFRSDVSALIANFQIVVHASISGEPFGQVIVEGMAAGKPVVATNGGGVPEIVIGGITGLLVPMGDSPAMAEAICRLLEDHNLTLRMGRLVYAASRKTFRSNKRCGRSRKSMTHSLSRAKSDR